MLSSDKGQAPLRINTSRQGRPSLANLVLRILEGLELAFTADARHHEFALLVLDHEARGDELLQQVDGGISMRLLRLHRLDLGLEGVVLHELGLGALLLQHLGGLLVFDLLLRTPPLGSGL